ncbi:MAG: TlyA family RNA methyltransferase [Deltaproteobacteria bacterium]|nr:TlyA family RNA methyltransferase [Deltaproteobacteria bacterium]MBW1846308.1 TlyA family RNA methyltransferase [Deltaproteobacteria bacterium]MBW2364745.1 TlyA family RNA methyltransferase [Deltaproteobacteria bacterium]
MVPAKKERIDILLVDYGLAKSRERGKSLIMSGKVLVDNKPISKPGMMVSLESEIRLKGKDIPYVSRGGLKLEKALTAFQLDVEGYDCLDIGSSTGGFTDCLLQKGAKRVFAVDVGYGQLAWKLRKDPKVIVFERTNIRNMPFESLPCPVNIVTIDVSFISLKIVVPSTLKFTRKNAIILPLIKPQFEIGKGKVGKGGIVKDSAAHDAVINDLNLFFNKIGLQSMDIIESPILGTKGNKEFFMALKKLENLQ